jgi:putative hemolysin
MLIDCLPAGASPCPAPVSAAPVSAAPARLAVRLAMDEADIAAVQHLRWRVFMDEMGVAAPAGAPQRDADPFDALCDHLLVTDADPATGEVCVVGTYRLLRGEVASRNGGFYTEREFDLGQVRAHAQGAGELLELGRACVLPAWRTSHTIQLLWRGIADYVGQYRIGAMFGCASFPGTDPRAHAASLSYLAHHCLAPADRRPTVRSGILPGVMPGLGIALEQLAPGSYDERRALFGLPPLVKGYLRAGARFGDGAFIDHDFGSIDVCVVLPMDTVNQRYASRFNVAA